MSGRRFFLILIVIAVSTSLHAISVRNISSAEFTTYADDYSYRIFSNTLIAKLSRDLTLEVEAGMQDSDYVESPRFKGGAFFTLPFFPGAYSEFYYQWYQYYDKTLYAFQDKEDIPSVHKLYYDITKENPTWYWNVSTNGTYSTDTWSVTGAGAAKWYGNDVYNLFGKYTLSAVAEPDEFIFDHTLWGEGSAKPDDVMTFRSGGTLGFYNTPFEDDKFAFHGSFLLGSRMQMTKNLGLVWSFEYFYSDTRQYITNGFTIDLNFI